MIGEIGVYRDESGAVLGPCPGCELWQVDYTNAVAQEWITIRSVSEDVFEMSSEEPIDSFPRLEADTSAWHQVIEDILMEHLRECAHLQRLLAEEGRADLLDLL